MQNLPKSKVRGGTRPADDREVEIAAALSRTMARP